MSGKEYTNQKVNNLLRLQEISELRCGWDGEGSTPFSEYLIDKCREMIDGLCLQPHIYPTGRNSIQFEYEFKDKTYLEFEVFADRVNCMKVPKREYANHKFERVESIERMNEILSECIAEQSDGSESLAADVNLLASGCEMG